MFSLQSPFVSTRGARSLIPRTHYEHWDSHGSQRKWGRESMVEMLIRKWNRINGVIKESFADCCMRDVERKRSVTAADLRADGK